MEIVGLYEFDDEYQVIDLDRTVLFQGSKADCKKYINKNKTINELTYENSNGTKRDFDTLEYPMGGADY